TLATETNLRSNVAIPFKVRDRDAILVLYSNDAYAFPDELVKGYEVIAKELEFAVAHVKSVNDLAKALGATTIALSSVAEVRDPYTAGHQANVGELGLAIAQALALEPALADLVKKAGQLLDVGKIAVPLELLVRPGSLSEIEFDIVKQHTTLGEKILSDASLPWPLAEVAVQHHERVDGSGYPMGLRGGEISLPSRIIAVADVVDAMTHHRPYRAAYSLNEALSYVSMNAGTLFDADVARACISVFDAGFNFESSGRR
ncbi:MAG: HD domain-containing phosphohydrolase, partial [Acidimicrobiales bacterium]